MTSETNNKIDIKINKSKKVLIETNLLSALNKLAISLNNRNLYEEPYIKQGLLFGYEDEGKIEVTFIYPTVLNFYVTEDEFNSNINNIKTITKNTRLDFVPLGFFFVTDDIGLNKNQLNTILKFRSFNPQCLLAYYSPSVLELNLKRLTDKIVSLNTDADIRNYQDYPIELFNKHYSADILEEVSYSQINDDYTTFSVMNNEENLIYDNTDINKNVFLNDKL